MTLYDRNLEEYVFNTKLEVRQSNVDMLLSRLHSSFLTLEYYNLKPLRY